MGTSIRPAQETTTAWALPDAASVCHCIRHASSSLEMLPQPAPTFEGSLPSPEDTGHLPEQHPLSRGSWHVTLISYRKHELIHWFQSYFTDFYQVKDDTLRKWLEVIGNAKGITLEERNTQKHPGKYKFPNLQPSSCFILTCVLSLLPMCACIHTHDCTYM